MLSLPPSKNVHTRSSYKGVFNHQSPQASFVLPTKKSPELVKPPNTIIHFVEKDYYGDEILGESVTQLHSLPLRPLISNWWSYTFLLATWPFFLFGFPVHKLLLQSKNGSKSDQNSMSTLAWVKLILFAGGEISFNMISFFLFSLAVLTNVYTIYKFVLIFNTLYVSAKYEMYLFRNSVVFVKYLVLLLPLDYTWLWGYEIHSLISRWNHLHGTYRGVGCRPFNYRFRVFTMIIMMLGIHGIRCLTELRHALQGTELATIKKAELILESVVELGHCLILPLYCTFCYAVKFHLYIIKALVYRWIHDGVTPGGKHLNEVKILYTQVSDSMLMINGWFYFYLSVVMFTITGETMVGAGIAFGSYFISSNVGPVLGLLTTANRGWMLPPQNNINMPSTEDIRELHLKVAGIILMIGLLFWTIWQAVKTNDTAREIHIWLNDLATGGGGADAQNILKNLGVVVNPTDNDDVTIIKTNEGGHQISGNSNNWSWPTNSVDIEFLEKLKLLKAYIHVKMELEDAALLNIAVVGMLKPNLSGRLARYRVVF